MKVSSRYCDSCGVKISAQEIEEEVALKYEDSYYCKDCKGEILPLLDKKGGAKAAAPANGNGNGNGAAPKRPAAPAAKPGASAAPKPSTPAAKPAAKASAPASGAVKRPAASASRGPKPAPAARPAPRRPAREEEPEEADDSAEELDAEDAPPKKNLVPLIAAGAGIVVVAVAGFFMLRGGGGAPAGPQGEPVAVVRSSPREKAQKAWAQAMASVKDRPVGEQRKTLDDFIRSDANPLGGDAGVMNEAQAYVEKLDEDFNKQGEAAFKDVVARAKAQADSGDFEGAVATLRGYPRELQESAWFKTNVQSEISKYEGNVAAKAEAEPIIRKAKEYAGQKEWRLAVGVLDGFDAQTYGSSPFASEVATLRRQYDDAASSTEQDAAIAEIEKKDAAEREAAKAAAAKKRADEDKRIATLKWEALSTDDLFTWKLPSPSPKDAWKPNSPNAKELTAKTGGEQAAAGVGSKSWLDVIVELRYKVVSGGFHVGLRSNGEHSVECQPDLIADGQWHTLTLSARGTGEDAFQQIVEGAAKPLKNDGDAAATSGGVALIVLPQSECVFTDMRVRVISKQ